MHTFIIHFIPEQKRLPITSMQLAPDEVSAKCQAVRAYGWIKQAVVLLYENVSELEYE